MLVCLHVLLYYYQQTSPASNACTYYNTYITLTVLMQTLVLVLFIKVHSCTHYQHMIRIYLQSVIVQ